MSSQKKKLSKTRKGETQVDLFWPIRYLYTYISRAETGLVLLVPGTTNNSVNVIQNGLKIIH